MTSIFEPITTGTVLGLPCGPRANGLTLARAEKGEKAHLVFDAAWRYAPALHALATERELDVKEDGRIVITPASRPDPLADLAAIEAVLERGGRGGIAPGDYAGVYTVEQASTGWAYIVTCTPAGRASLKRIGTWTGADNTFRVDFADAGKLASVLERAETSKVKGTTTTVKLPEVAGITIKVDGAEILIGWPGTDAEAEILRKVPSLRWDAARKAYVVTTRYAKRTAKALDEIVAHREAGAERAEALRGLLADLPFRHLAVTISGHRVDASYSVSCDGAYQALSRLGRVKERAITVGIGRDTDPTALAGALRTAEEALAAAAAERQAQQRRYAAEKAAADSARATARANRIQVRADRAPAPGTAFRNFGGIVVCTELGRSWTDRITNQEMRYAYYRAAGETEVAAFMAAEAAAVKTGSLKVAAAAAPEVGQPYRLRDGSAVVVTGRSKSWYVDTERDESATSLYSSHLWDTHVVEIDWRAATEAEAAELESREAEEAARQAVVRQAKELRASIHRLGSSEWLGHVPAGEVLWEDTRNQAYGSASWLILADDGRLWLVDYQGADGDSWGDYNCGYNTHGRVAAADPETVAVHRAAAALAGFAPYRKETKSG